MTGRGRKRAAPPASTQISAVAQLLGEIRVDERDNEWMYALHGAAADADGANLDSTCADPKLMRAHDVGRAAARARAIFHSQTPTGRADADGDDAACADASGSMNDESDTAAVGESPRAFGALSLAATNRAFMLVADIMRAAARVAADAAAQGAALSGSQKQPQPPRLSGSTLAIHHSPNLGSGTGGQTSFAATLNSAHDVTLTGFLAQFDALLEGASPLEPTVTALRQLVSASLTQA
jgi:hypothetical protein